MCEVCIETIGELVQKEKLSLLGRQEAAELQEGSDTRFCLKNLLRCTKSQNLFICETV